MRFDKNNHSNETLIDLYKALIRPRLIEEKMLILLRQNKISKWFSGIGQEAISVGATMALFENEYILPLHRNLGVFTSRNCSLVKLIAQWQGKLEGFTKGRDRSFHFGTHEHHIIGMISHLGAMLPVADGIALANKIQRKPKVTLVFSGDGGTSQGDFHEAVNVAAVWNLPVIFLIENNGYGLSTPSEEQFRCKDLIDKAIGYGIESKKIDGNNILEVYENVSTIAKSMRNNPRPYLIEAVTFRMRGHEEASGVKYVPAELLEMWNKKDPVINYERFIIEAGIISIEEINKIKSDYKSEIDRAVETAFSLPDPEFDFNIEAGEMFAPFIQTIHEPESEEKTEKRFIDSISDALWESMEKFPNLIIMGQDVAEYGGAFKVTEGFIENFGKHRVRNTPLCESAIIGIGLGLSIRGFKSVIEMQFADFVSCGFNQIVNNLAKNFYRWAQNADVVIRMPTGAGSSAGPFHSQSNEAWFFHTPGLKIVYPSNPFDAKGLLNAAIEDPNPIMYFEHKLLYRSLTAVIPASYYTIPIGKAKLVNEGDEISIITYGIGVHWAKEIINDLNIPADILDLRTLLPWDKEAVTKTVKNTGRVLICHEDTITGGIGAEIAAWISENLFEFLDAPVLREGSLDMAVPFAKNLEKGFLPKERIKEKITGLIKY